jgi:hypothetical protein
METSGGLKMAHLYNVEYTDTFSGEANYCWVVRKTITMPELTHYGYDGSSGYAKANRIAQRETMKAAKAAVGLTGVRGRTSWNGDGAEFRPYGMATILFVTWTEPENAFDAEEE